jgi:hypothetical protein
MASTLESGPLGSFFIQQQQDYEAAQVSRPVDLWAPAARVIDRVWQRKLGVALSTVATIIVLGGAKLGLDLEEQYHPARKAVYKTAHVGASIYQLFNPSDPFTNYLKAEASTIAK